MVFLPVLGFPRKPTFLFIDFNLVPEQGNNETLEKSLGETHTELVVVVAAMEKLQQV